MTSVSARPPSQRGKPRQDAGASTVDKQARYRRTVSYASSGVSIQARPEVEEARAERAPRRGPDSALRGGDLDGKAATRSEVLDGAGGFAGLFRLGLSRFTSPVLATSSDGVGPKLSIAQQMDIHDTIGVDLVAMVADDIVASGAEPLFVQYYLTCGEVVPDRVTAVVGGVRDGCRIAGCAMLGGETAEHAEVLRPHEYDLSGSGVGVVDEERLLGPHRVEVGDAVVAMGSSGLHANGYGLVRHALLGIARMRLDAIVEEFENQRSLGEELLTPTRIYAKDCLDLLVEAEVRALAHITGGGVAANVERILPEGVDAVIERSSWRPAAIFDLVARKGRIEQAEMEATFNMGVGMAAVVAPEDSERTVAFLRGRGLDAWVAGEITDGTGTVRLVGSHTRG